MHRLQHVHTPQQPEWAPAGQPGLEGSLQLPLSSLDVSYCNLTTQAVVDLLLRGCSLKVCCPTCLSLCHLVDAKCAGDVRLRVFFQPLALKQFSVASLCLQGHVLCANLLASGGSWVVQTVLPVPSKIQ